MCFMLQFSAITSVDKIKTVNLTKSYGRVKKLFEYIGIKYSFLGFKLA